jgi:hypothetical protein
VYSIDASAFIDGWVRYYPPDVLPSLWANIDALVSSGIIRATEEVKFELGRGADPLHAWCCSHAELFVTSTSEIQVVVAEIVNRFPNFMPERSPDGIWADPYVIGLAKVEGRIVVTGEKRAAQNAKPKMPNICDALNVESISLLEMIRRERWQF